MLGKGGVGLTKVTLVLVHEFYTYMLNTHCVPGSMYVAGGLEMNQSDLQMPASPPIQNLRSQALVAGTAWEAEGWHPQYHPPEGASCSSHYGILPIRPELRAKLVPQSGMRSPTTIPLVTKPLIKPAWASYCRPCQAFLLPRGPWRVLEAV